MVKSLAQHLQDVDVVQKAVLAAYKAQRGIARQKPIGHLSPHHLSTASRSPRPDFVNVGVYGIPADGRPVPDVIEELEELTHSLGGRKMLYAVNRIPEERFWQIYDKEDYNSLREDVQACDILQDLYRKIRR